jgi:hypothetical protein
MRAPIFATILADPRVQAALEDYAQQEDELRAAVRVFFNDRARGGA